MSAHLVTINGVDFTGWVNRKTYSATHEEEGFSWQDVNLKTHRIIQRTRVKASFTMTFFNEANYETFLTALGSLTTHTVNLYVDTMGADQTISAAIKYSTQTIWTSPAYDEIAGIYTVTVEISEL